MVDGGVLAEWEGFEPEPSRERVSRLFQALPVGTPPPSAQVRPRGQSQSRRQVRRAAMTDRGGGLVGGRGDDGWAPQLAKFNE